MQKKESKEKKAKRIKAFNEDRDSKPIEGFVLGNITKTAHLMKVILFKDKLKEVLDENPDEQYVIGYVGCNKAGMVIGGYKSFAAILKPNYFDFSSKAMDNWSDAKKQEFKLLRERRVSMNWALANNRITLQEYDMKVAELDEKMSKMRGSK
jgi:hypothetical protein